MEADTLTKIGTIVQLNRPVYPDSTAVMLKDWSYSTDSVVLYSQKVWLQDSGIFNNKQDDLRFLRHQGLARTNKIMSESLLLFLLLFEVLLVAYLLNNGLKFINASIRNAFSSDERSQDSSESGLHGSRYRYYLWILSIVIFALMSPILINSQEANVNEYLNSWIVVRFFIYVLLYFFVKDLIYRILGNVFFTPMQTERWIKNSKTIISFYALSLTPILIGYENGLAMSDSFIFFWVVGFLLIMKVWLLVKAIRIFSVKIGDIFYLILYLCTLEIMPVFLYYKGLFLL